MRELSPTACLTYGWETFNRRPGILIGGTLIVFAANFAMGFADGVLNAVASAAFGEFSAGSIAVAVVVWLLVLVGSNLLNMGNAAFSLKAHDDVSSVSLSSLWHPQYFWRFLATYILFGLSVAAGLFLLIIPGIIFLLMFGFSLYVVVDRGLEPIAAMRESRRITDGNRLNILGLLVLVILVNILGFLAAIIGLLVTVPVTALAMVHAYRTLASNDAPEAVATPAPVAT